jgi:hypothetical protein
MGRVSEWVFVLAPEDHDWITVNAQSVASIPFYSQWEEMVACSIMIKKNPTPIVFLLLKRYALQILIQF